MSAARNVMGIITGFWMLTGMAMLMTLIVTTFLGHPMGGSDFGDLAVLAGYGLSGAGLVFGWWPLLFPHRARQGAAERRAMGLLITIILALPTMLSVFLICAIRG